MVTSLAAGAGVRPGIQGDENTNVNQPVFDRPGRRPTSPAPSAGLTVLAEFNGLHGGDLDLAPGAERAGLRRARST